MTHDEEPLLTISMYYGQYVSDLASLFHICDVEGSIVPDGRHPFSLLAEALKVLEMCVDKYGAPRPSVEYVTVFIGRKTRTEVKPLARMAVATRNGRAGASVRLDNSTRVDTKVAYYGDDDDVVTIVRKVLKVFVSG